jgi:hypothetical protein
MIPGPAAERIKVQLVIFWAIWLADLVALVGIYFLLGRESSATPPAGLLVNLAGFAPLFISIVIRWLILPRAIGPGKALVMFIMGLALAEACGILGLFLGGPYRESLFVLGVLGVTSYVPLFVKRQLEPKGSGFIPNH